LLGHSSITQTMDTYSHLLGDVNDGARTRDLRSHKPSQAVPACPGVSSRVRRIRLFAGFSRVGGRWIVRCVRARISPVAVRLQ
jgi:hypothetical protein